MANNCLVTKLKGTVQDGSLPILNTIRVDLLSSDLRIGDIETLLIGTGVSPVVIESQVPFHIGSTSAASVTQYTIPANTLQNIVFTSSEMPSGALDNAFSIRGGIYGLTSFTYYLNSGWFTIKDADYNSLKFAGDLVNQVCKSKDEAFASVQIITIDDKDSGNLGQKYPYIFTDTKDTVKILWSLQNTATGIKPMIVKDVTDKLPNVEHLSIRFTGNINTLPLSVKALYAVSSETVGSLEEFVADRRSRGKTSGVLAFYTPQYTWPVTYQGTAIKDMSLSERPIISNWSYFVWDASAMGFSSSVPEGFTTYDSLFAATRDAINGVL